MGASQSCNAEAAAERGWPAYMSQVTLRRVMHRFVVEKSVLGDRVRFRQNGEVYIEYVRLPAAACPQVTYQRRDEHGPLPAFPRYLARRELPVAFEGPHEVVDVRPGGACLRHPTNGAHATYALQPNGTWTREGVGTSLAGRLKTLAKPTAGFQPQS